jgi:hypothetical protein
MSAMKTCPFIRGAYSDPKGCRRGEPIHIFRLKAPNSLKHFPFVQHVPFISKSESERYTRVVNAVFSADTEARQTFRTLGYLAGFKKPTPMIRGIA